MSLRLIQNPYETIEMDQEQLRIDLEYITQMRALPVEESLRTVLARLDICAQLPNIPERLQHYLSKRSYAKALAWLDDPDSPHHP